MSHPARSLALTPFLNGKKRIGKKERERIIDAFASVIRYIARQIGTRLPLYIVGVDDLVNAGVIGLIDAIEKYDSSRDNTFKTYAEFRIRGAMLDELRRLDWAPRSVRQKETAIERAGEELEHHLGRSADNEEVAALLGVEIETLNDWLKQIHSVSLLHLEMLEMRTKDGDQSNLLEILPSDDAESPVNLTEIKCLKKCLQHAIENLPYQERVVLFLYYYEELTMKEIGTILEVTQSRISQIHTKAIDKLSEKFSAEKVVRNLF